MNHIAKYQAIVDRGDFNRSAQALLLDLIHVYTDYEVPLHRVFFFEAGALDQRPEIAVDEDTFVRADVDPGYDHRLPGQNGFLYRRLPLALLQGIDGLEPLVLPDDYPFTTHGILSQINRYYSVQLRPQDVVNETFDLSTTEVWLRCTPGSYCFFGERRVPVQLGVPPKARITNDGALRITDTQAFRVAV